MSEKELPQKVQKKIQIEVLLKDIIDDFVESDIETAACDDTEQGQLYLLDSGTYKIIKHSDDKITIEGDVTLVKFLEE